MRFPLLVVTVGISVWFGYSVILQTIVPVFTDVTKVLGQ